jgi:hypothetical protein
VDARHKAGHDEESAMADIKSLTAADLLRLYRKRELSPVEVTRDQLARIDKFEPAINGFIIVDREGALKAAQASEARWQKGEPIGLADGLGATVKDNIWLKGFPARRGSLTSSDAPMKEDAPAVARLRESGAVILGKTTLPEFGWIGAGHSPALRAIRGGSTARPEARPAARPRRRCSTSGICTSAPTARARSAFRRHSPACSALSRASAASPRIRPRRSASWRMSGR